MHTKRTRARFGRLLSRDLRGLWHRHRTSSSSNKFGVCFILFWIVCFSKFSLKSLVIAELYWFSYVSNTISVYTGKPQMQKNIWWILDTEWDMDIWCEKTSQRSKIELKPIPQMFWCHPRTAKTTLMIHGVYVKTVQMLLCSCVVDAASFIVRRNARRAIG